MENNAVFGSLIENLENIQVVFSPTEKVFKVDRDSTGSKKEVTVQEFIGSYLTRDFRLKKGHIFSQKSKSNNIDCVVLAPNHPRLITPKREIILAEGVFAAVEIKPDIYNKIELERGLQQIKSVKLLDRKVSSLALPNLGVDDLKDFQKKIPCVIFSAKSLTPDNMYAFLRDQIIEGKFTVFDLPDLIVTLDHGLFVISPDISVTPLSPMFLAMNPKLSTCQMINFQCESVAASLSLFLIHLLCFPTAYLLDEEPILLNYLTGVTIPKLRAWSFSEDI